MTFHFHAQRCSVPMSGATTTIGAHRQGDTGNPRLWQGMFWQAPAGFAKTVSIFRKVFFNKFLCAKTAAWCACLRDGAAKRRSGFEPEHNEMENPIYNKGATNAPDK